MTAGGVPAGATSPNQVMARRLSAGYPASANVGTCGSAGSRWGAATAKGTRRPDCTRLLDDGYWSLSTWVSPDSALLTTGPWPLYGIWRRRTPSASFIASAIRWPMEPTPADPIV